MKSVFFVGLLCLVSAYIDGPKTLYPGYVINYKTPKNKGDDHYTYFPITGIDPSVPTNLVLGLDIETNNPISPEAQIRMGTRTVPSFTGSPVFSSYPTDTTTIANITNNLYWLSSKANCANSVASTCYDNVEAEVSAWTQLPSPNNTHWPYMMIDQRRTAKFSIPSGAWVYFWLLITNDNLDSNGVFSLYMGCQFWSNGDNSAVQMSIYDYNDDWPTGPGNTSVALARDFYPRDRQQKDDWIQPSPSSLKTGIFKVGAQNTISNTGAKFTVKVGFNKPPVQAANLNASFNRFGFLILIATCIMMLKH